MANRITVLRLLLLFVVVGLIYLAPPAWRVIDAPLVLIVFALDGLDGPVARRRGEESIFGSVFDIAADRITENVLWIVACDLGYVPAAVPIVFVTRGFLVDLVRSAGAAQGEAPFDQMRTPLGRLLVSHPLVRFVYGSTKAAAFALILWLHAQPGTAVETLLRAKDVLVGVSVVLCLARGLPVLIEAATATPETQRRQDAEAQEDDGAKPSHPANAEHAERRS